MAVKKRPDEFRDAFDTDDLKALFGSKEYRQDSFKRGYQFWTPIIALYTGCRIEEICQLHLDDIRKEDGLWVLDINDDDEKKLKNLSSQRLVPLHLVLVDELKLPDYPATLWWSSMPLVVQARLLGPLTTCNTKKGLSSL